MNITKQYFLMLISSLIILIVGDVLNIYFMISGGIWVLIWGLYLLLTLDPMDDEKPWWNWFWLTFITGIILSIIGCIITPPLSDGEILSGFYGVLMGFSGGFLVISFELFIVGVIMTTLANIFGE